MLLLVLRGTERGMGGPYYGGGGGPGTCNAHPYIHVCIIYTDDTSINYELKY